MLEREYGRLCSAFPRFAAACSQDWFLTCIADVCASWTRKISAAAQYRPALSSRAAMPVLPVEPLLPLASAAEPNATAEAFDTDEAFEVDVCALWEPCPAGPGFDCGPYDFACTDALRAAECSCGSPPLSRGGLGWAD